MTLFTKNEIILALGEELISTNFHEEITFDEIIIDSRKASPKKLFFALKGDNNDGHNFLDEVLTKSCEAAIIHDPRLIEKFPKTFLVRNTFTSLYKLAEFSRQRSAAKIIAITGSVGKTGTKEMLKIAFATTKKTYATTGNLNNHFGVPLTLCNMQRDVEIAIIEMGMNHLNEIESLSKLTRPHFAIVTNVAPAHIGNFHNEEEIAVAKSEIFSGLDSQGLAIINHDNKYYDFLKKIAERKNQVISFGKNTNSTYCLQSLENKDSTSCNIKVITKNHGEVFCEISSSHAAMIYGALITITCVDLILEDITKSLNALKNIKAAKGRGEIIDKKIGDKNITIIDDTYNASVSSMKAGIEYLAELQKNLHKKRSVAILGDMFELGDKSQQLHEEALIFLDKLDINLILLVGENMKNAAQKISSNKKINKKIFLTSKELAGEIKNLLEDGDVLLIKGSRGMKMEVIIEKIN